MSFVNYFCHVPNLGVVAELLSQIDNCPHKSTRVFPACFVLTHTLYEKTSHRVTHPSVTPGQARLILEFPRLSYRKEDTSCWSR